MKKIRVAFIFESSNIFLSGHHFDNTYYHFFINALKRNERLEMTYFPTKEIFDASILKDNFDIILLWQNTEFGMPKEILGIQELDIPVIADVCDPQDAKNALEFHKKWKIDHYFHYYPKELFHELFPKKFNYTSIVFGIEPSLYQNISPFENRIKNRILNSGAIGNAKFLSRIINSIRNPKWNSYRYYTLRTKCNKLPYVDYTATLDHNFIGDRYTLLLQKYGAAIAATSVETTIKYWEIPAAGCLTFMEITKKNKGNYLGFIDNETSIFIDENNYQEKFREFLSDQENPKWKKIANAGREHAIANFNNDKACESLVDLMKTLI
tara:strand:+ start:3460 stop:4431 length:972 start_codon:yes stop_codon:yes gene_type:complete